MLELIILHFGELVLPGHWCWQAQLMWEIEYTHTHAHAHTRTHTLQMWVTSQGCYLYFWPISYKSEIPIVLILGLVNLLEQFTALRETFYLLYQRFIKWYNSEKAMEEMHGWDREKGLGAPIPSPGASLSQQLHMLTTQKLSETLILRFIFMEILSIHMTG